MLTIVFVSVAVPVAAGAAYLALRRTLPRFATDSRGIALQTVIVMVVLLVIAGGAAAVLLTRGGEAINQLEQQEIVSHDPADIKSEGVCRSLNFVWDTASNACTT